MPTRRHTHTLLLGSALACWSLPSAVRAAAALAPTPGVMLASDWHDGLDPKDYLVSEKLDGVRALWDGKALRFKSGRPIAAPAWWLKALPDRALDGELWLGRGRFERLSGIVRHQNPVDADWRALRYMVFDFPGGAGPFAERAELLQALFRQRDAAVLALPQMRVDDRAALKKLLAQTVAAGGEGLMLHRADALWQAGRSSVLCKLKAQPDAEGRVVAIVPGKGKHAGRMGALRLELPDGRQFNLGTGFSDAQREHPPAIGSIVTYRYRDTTGHGLPRFASFLRVREAE